MAKQKFLGKSAPDSFSPPAVKRQTPQPLMALLILILAPLVLAISILYLLFVDFVQAPQTNPSNPPPISFSYSEIARAADSTTTTPAANQGCNISPYPDAPNYLDASQIFPIIPDRLRVTGENNCPPAQWNLNVVRYFIFKGLTFINWLAAALAIILTVIAGLYYISGFANEANVKKGKSILISAYAGLVIVILARVLIYGSAQLFSGTSTYDPDNVPNHSSDFINK